MESSRVTGWPGTKGQAAAVGGLQGRSCPPFTGRRARASAEVSNTSSRVESRTFRARLTSIWSMAYTL